MNITDIPIGRKNAITRAELAAMWRVTDREARRTIAEYRAATTPQDYAILSSSHGDGYWRSNDKAEIQQFVIETTARGRNVFASLKSANMVLNAINTAGQVRI